MNRIVMGVITVVVALIASAIGVRIWTVGDAVRTSHSAQSGESTATLSYAFLLFVFLGLVSLIAFANTWRRKPEPPDQAPKTKSRKRGRDT